MKKANFATLVLLLTLLASAQAQLKGNDGQPVEAGLRFTATDSLSGAQFFKPAASTWVISLYDSAGNRLDSAVSGITSAGWSAVDFSRAYAPGSYTVSYYSASGDYAYKTNYFIADSAFLGFRTPKSAGVYRYGRGLPSQSYGNASYEIWPVVSPVSYIYQSDTTVASALIVVVNPDGSPVRLPDGTSAAKLLIGDPPGKLLETFLRYVNGTMYRYELYEFGVKRFKRTTNQWVPAPY